MASRIGLIVASLLASLLALELGLRAFHPSGDLTYWSNFVADARTALAETEGSRFTHDPQLGHVPEGGLRGNGGPPPAGARPIVAVGDSFTYGEEVRDGETWPAHLERLLVRPVLNGGVSGYGFDQIVLRAEALARQHKPAAVIVSFIADDIRRTEMRRLWGADKPYFDLLGDRLVLDGVPVPPRAAPKSTLGFWQRTLGYSFLFDFAMRRLNLLHDWFGDHIRVHPAGRGADLACHLSARLVALQEEIGAPVLLFAQYDPVMWQDTSPSLTRPRFDTYHLMTCAKLHGLDTIDSFDALAARQADIRRHYVLWHMSDTGNKLMAELVAETLAKRKLD